MAPEDRDLLISVMKFCQKKLPGMFQVRETSGARLTSEDRSPESMSQSTETLGDTRSCSTPPALDSGYDSPTRGSKSICNYSYSGSDPPVDRSSPHSVLASDLLFDTFQPSTGQESMGPNVTADFDHLWSPEWQALISGYPEEPALSQYILGSGKYL